MTPCDEFVDQLVDYVDGDLPRDEATAVAGHLAVCESCRQTAAALERSLTLAKVIWTDNVGQSEPARHPVPLARFRGIRSLAVAASILVGVTVLTMTVRQRPATRLEEMERQIARAGAAAELLVATQILARCEGTEALVEKQHQFILTEYAGTPAAESIRAQRGSR